MLNKELLQGALKPVVKHKLYFDRRIGIETIPASVYVYIDGGASEYVPEYDSVVEFSTADTYVRVIENPDIEGNVPHEIVGSYTNLVYRNGYYYIVDPNRDAELIFTQ